MAVTSESLTITGEDMAKLVNPTDVKTLKDWVARWPKTQNLEFDATTREPAIFTAVKRSDAGRVQVGKIPWKREGDTMTILSNPERFATGAVTTARKRYAAYRTNQRQVTIAADEQLRLQEATLLEAHRAYREAPPATRPTLLRDVLQAQKALSDMEQALAEQLQKERAVVFRENVTSVYNPPIPWKARTVPLTDVAGGQNVTPMGSSSSSNRPSE